MAEKRESEELNKSPKRIKLNLQQYVSKNNGSIDKLYLNKKLICFLYEQNSVLIKVSDINGEILNVKGINEYYCYVEYKKCTGQKKCYNGCNVKKYSESKWKFLDTVNQRIFSINIEKWSAQEGCEQWAFATNHLVIKYVEAMTPEDLIISTIAIDEKMVTFKQDNIEICVKVKKDSNPFQLC